MANSDDHGDRPRPLPEICELEEATSIFEREEAPSWGFDVSKDYYFGVIFLILRNCSLNEISYREYL